MRASGEVRTEGTTGQVADTGGRFVFLDSLRTAMIFLVVLYHSGAVYESSGFFASFWLVDDPAANDLVGIVNVIIDIFAMPVIFFVSGFLAPIFLYSRHLPQEHWTTYFHFSNGIFSQSWLWFLPVLLLFDAVFRGMSKLGRWPPRIPLKAAVTGVFILGTLYGFSVSMAGLTGWTKTFLVDFQNERLLIYFLVFLFLVFLPGPCATGIGSSTRRPRARGCTSLWRARCGSP